MALLGFYTAKLAIMMLGLPEEDEDDCYKTLQDLYKTKQKNANFLLNVDLALQDLPDLFKSQFKHFFVLNESQVENLMISLAPYYVTRQNAKKIWPLQKVTLASLWLLAHCEKYEEVASRFKTSKKTICICFETFNRLVSIYLSYKIAWPKDAVVYKTVAAFEGCGINNTMGVMDCCHIHMGDPISKKNRVALDEYLNSLKIYSVNLLAVCDPSLTFTYVFVGCPGKYHDSKAFEMSDLCTFLEERPHELVPKPFYLIADEAFPLTNQIITPYSRSKLTSSEAKFNTKLITVKQIIVKAFNLLKSRFQRLQYLPLKNIVDISHAIHAACILHNICLEEQEVIIGEENNGFLPQVPFEQIEEAMTWPICESALRRRDAIASML